LGAGSCSPAVELRGAVQELLRVSEEMRSWQGERQRRARREEACEKDERVLAALNTQSEQVAAMQVRFELFDSI
jgi:hypothetical protein